MLQASPPFSLLSRTGGAEKAEVPSLAEVLTMLAGGLGVGTVISFLLEKVGLFQGPRSEAKW
jgi:hypothetical protein